MPEKKEVKIEGKDCSWEITFGESRKEPIKFRSNTVRALDRFKREVKKMGGKMKNIVPTSKGYMVEIIKGGNKDEKNE